MQCTSTHFHFFNIIYSYYSILKKTLLLFYLALILVKKNHLNKSLKLNLDIRESYISNELFYVER